MPAAALLWALLMARVLRESAFAAVEALVRSRAQRRWEHDEESSLINWITPNRHGVICNEFTH
jgi:hypothetical protein